MTDQEKAGETGTETTPADAQSEVAKLKEEKKAWLNEKSQLGRKFADFEARLEEMAEREERIMQAYNQSNDLLTSLATKSKDTGDDDMGYNYDENADYVKKADLDSYWENREKQREESSKKETEKYKNEYHNQLRKMVAENKYNLSDKVIQALQDDVKSKNPSFSGRVTGNAAADATINFNDALNYVLAQRLAGKDTAFRSEIPEGALGIGSVEQEKQRSEPDIEIDPKAAMMAKKMGKDVEWMKNTLKKAKAGLSI